MPAPTDAWEVGGGMDTLSIGLAHAQRIERLNAKR